MRHFPPHLKGEVCLSGEVEKHGIGVCQSPWVKAELSFNLVEGQLYLLTYVNEYRGGP